MRALCALALALLLAGCQDDGARPVDPQSAPANPAASAPLTPAQVVRRMLQAARDGDDQRFWSCCTRGVRQKKDLAEQAVGRPRRMFQVLAQVWTEQASLVVGAEQIAGDEATVGIAGDRVTRAFLLVREEGDWRYAGEIAQDGTRNELERQIDALLAKLKKQGPR